ALLLPTHCTLERRPRHGDTDKRAAMEDEFGADDSLLEAMAAAADRVSSQQSRAGSSQRAVQQPTPQKIQQPTPSDWINLRRRALRDPRSCSRRPRRSLRGELGRTFSSRRARGAIRS
ncbi:hypothetical protein V2G26_006115, partial [Clonostachys chloroleuca]